MVYPPTSTTTHLYYTTITNTADPWPWWNLAYTNNQTTASTLIVQAPQWQWQAWNATYTETAEYSAVRQARLAACSRAEELLLSLLTDEQAADYEQHGWFEVRGSKGGRWRIRDRGQAGNVDLMPEIGSERMASYCCHPPDSLPTADAHLAQLLHLVTDEDGFRRTANVAYRRPAAALPGAAEKAAFPRGAAFLCPGPDYALTPER